MLLLIFLRSLFFKGDVGGYKDLVTGGGCKLCRLCLKDASVVVVGIGFLEGFY